MGISTEDPADKLNCPVGTMGSRLMSELPESWIEFTVQGTSFVLVSVNTCVLLLLISTAPKSTTLVLNASWHRVAVPATVTEMVGPSVLSKLVSVIVPPAGPLCVGMKRSDVVMNPPAGTPNGAAGTR